MNRSMSLKIAVKQALHTKTKQTIKQQQQKTGSSETMRTNEGKNGESHLSNTAMK